MFLPHSLIWQKKEIHCTQGPITCMLCIQLEHPNNSVLTKANLSAAFPCTSFPLQVAGLETSECFAVHDDLPTSYLLLYSFAKLPADLSFNSVHLWKSYATCMCFPNVTRNSARTEKLITVVNCHHWSHLQTINSVQKVTSRSIKFC